MLEGNLIEARRLALSMIYSAGSGHPGGALSCIEILTCLAEYHLDWSQPLDDSSFGPSLILSKGHACPALYAVATVYGLLEESELPTFRKLGSRLQGHPHVSLLPWVGSSTGSLGQGFSVALGRALGYRLKNIDSQVYCVLGDGELQEGQVWEAAAVAAHHKVDNLVAIVDYNKLQSDNFNSEICGLEPLDQRWCSFGWNVVEVDGHSIEDLTAALGSANQYRDKPTVIIAHTVKGKGVAFMENIPKWHGSVCLQPEEIERALLGLGMSSVSVKEKLAPYQNARDL